ncbi:MAG: hypothetical protein ACLPKI_15420 [Streptosporangiaceae bacterium]
MSGLARVADSERITVGTRGWAVLRRWAGGRDSQQRERAHRQHGVPVKREPQAQLMLVEAGLPVPLLEARSPPDRQGA